MDQLIKLSLDNPFLPDGLALGVLIASFVVALVITSPIFKLKLGEGLHTLLYLSCTFIAFIGLFLITIGSISAEQRSHINKIMENGEYSASVAYKTSFSSSDEKPQKITLTLKNGKDFFSFDYFIHRENAKKILLDTEEGRIFT